MIILVDTHKCLTDDKVAGKKSCWFLTGLTQLGGNTKAMIVINMAIGINSIHPVKLLYLITITFSLDLKELENGK